MRISHAITLLSAMLFGALLSLGAATIGARVIEAMSENAVEKQLLLSGQDWAQIEADGLQIVLSGTAPDEASQLAAQRSAGHVVDPARVVNVLAVEKAEEVIAPDFSIEILQNESGISLFGLIPTSWDRDGFISSIRAANRGVDISDLLEQADYAIPENWAATTRFGLSAISELSRSKVSLSATSIRVNGLADSKSERTEIERKLTRSSPDGVDVTLEIRAPRPVITPFTVRFLIDQRGPRFDACAAETDESLAQILDVANELGATTPRCIIGLGAPSSQWADAVESAMRALNGLGSGSVTLSDTEVSLIGAEGLDPKEFSRAAVELKSSLPSGFSLFSSLPDAPDAQEEAEATQFIVTRSSEGRVELKGRLPNGRSQEIVIAVAKAHFGAGDIVDGTRIEDGLPIGWTERAMATIEAFSIATHGAATMTPELISITGETGDDDAQANIARTLAGKLDDGQRYELDITYVAPPDPRDIVLSAPECVATANAVLEDQKILFSPGSVEVDPVSFVTLDTLADGLARCEDTFIEIGGHTDSQGREEMNLNLSQSRANSVLDAMLARRVAGVKFTAVGYGETAPIADNDTEEGREANRRIEFRLIDEANLDQARATPDEPAAETATDQEEKANE